MIEEYVSSDVERLMVHRPRADTQWETCMDSPAALLVVGPPRSGKHSYIKDRYERLAARRGPLEDEAGWSQFRSDPQSRILLVIHMTKFRPALSITEFFHNLRREILRLLNAELGLSNGLLGERMKNDFPEALRVARGFLPAVATLVRSNPIDFKGAVAIALCGLRYVFEDNRRGFFNRLRAFLDDVVAERQLERIRIVLTSVQDSYYLLNEDSDVCSPLNCLERMYVGDLSKEGFIELIELAKREANVSFENPGHLYGYTQGDAFLTKVIISICRSHFIQAADDLDREHGPVADRLVDKAVDSLITLERDECLPSFRLLLDYIETYDEVRGVLFDLWRGSASVPMVDTTGVYTIPESSGAVRKMEEEGKYVYVFRNPIYERVVDAYFRAEAGKAERILARAMGAGEMAFGSALASAIKHELGSPIVSLTEARSFIREADLQSAPLKDATSCLESASSSLAIIMEFLKSVATRSSKSELVGLNRYLERFISVFGSHLHSRGITLSFEPDQNVGTVHIESAALQIAMIQLITNARDGILEKGAGTIIVGTGTDSAGRIVIWVKDDGIGMDGIAQAQAILPGFSTKGGHAGIGLSLVVAAVRQMGGEVGVASEPGKGSTFSILLPRRPPVENEESIDS